MTLFYTAGRPTLVHNVDTVHDILSICHTDICCMISPKPNMYETIPLMQPKKWEKEEAAPVLEDDDTADDDDVCFLLVLQRQNKRVA